jgi:hypothetical protein
LEHAPFEPLPSHQDHPLPPGGLHDLIAAPEPTYREWGIAVEPAAAVRPDLPGWRSRFVVPLVAVAAILELKMALCDSGIRIPRDSTIARALPASRKAVLPTELLSRSTNSDQFRREDRTDQVATKIRRAGPNTHPVNP